MKVLLLLLLFIRDAMADTENNCSSLAVGLRISSLDETSTQVILTIPDSLGNLCIVKEVNFTVTPEIDSGTCKISSKSCTFDNLKTFTNYTLMWRWLASKIYPKFNEDQEGSPSSVNFFTAGVCLPNNILSLEFEDDKLKWFLNATFTPILDHYVITAKVNQERTCGGKTNPYLEDYILRNDSISLPKNVPGDWLICMKPIKRNQTDRCENHKCVSKYFPMEEHLAKVDRISLTSGAKSLTAKWSPNSLWPRSCSLDYYQIHLHPSPVGHPGPINSSCRSDNCEIIIKFLLPDTNYTIQITPIFSGNIRGKMDSRSEAPYSCPPAVTDLKIHEKNLSHFELSWADHNKYKADFYAVSLLILSPCNGSRPEISATVTTSSYVSKAVSPFFDANIKITSLRDPRYNCPASFTDMEIKATKKIPLLVEKLRLGIITETSAEISWTHPSDWKKVCIPSLTFEVDFHTSAEEIRNCTLTSCSLWNLKPFSNYAFTVRACAYTSKCQDSKLNFTTKDIYPRIPEDVFSVDYQDLESFVDYQNVTYQNGNCSIRVIDVRSNDTYSFVCTEEGKIQAKDLPSGRKYEVELEVCNSRGCFISKPFIAFSAPTSSELPNVVVKGYALNSSTLSLKFNSPNTDYNGSLYIVVSEVGEKHPASNVVEVFVRGMSNESAQGRSVVEKLPSRKHIIVESVPLDTLRYDLQKDLLQMEGLDTSNGIYVAPVMEYWSGGYSVVVAYDFCGPFKFEQMAVIFWICGSFGIMTGIVLLILMFQRKHSSQLPKPAHGRTKKFSFSTPTYESSQNNKDLDSECEEQSLNPERQKDDKAIPLQKVTKQCEYDSDETIQC